MLDFEYWLDGIVGTCELIVNRDVFEKSWIAQDYSRTSIHYYEELYEQLIDDLHLEESINDFSGRMSSEAVLVFQLFCKALLTLDREIENSDKLKNPKVLLSSRQWESFRDEAARVLALPDVQPYLHGKKTREIITRLTRENQVGGG